MKRKETIRSKVLSDCYELLHMAELGKGSLSELSEIFGIPGNKEESNYRQVERIKSRCQRAGIKLDLDTRNMRFRTEDNAKLKFLDAALKERVPTKPMRSVFGFYAEKFDLTKCDGFRMEDEE